MQDASAAAAAAAALTALCSADDASTPASCAFANGRALSQTVRAAPPSNTRRLLRCP